MIPWSPVSSVTAVINVSLNFPIWDKVLVTSEKLIGVESWMGLGWVMDGHGHGHGHGHGWVMDGSCSKDVAKDDYFLFGLQPPSCEQHNSIFSQYCTKKLKLQHKVQHVIST